MVFYGVLFLSGVLGGVLAGMLGIGGGIIYVFVLDAYLVDVGVIEQEYAHYIISNSLFCVFFASLSSCVNLIRHKEFYYKQVLLLGVPAVIASICTLLFVVNSHWFTREVFSYVIMVLLIYMLFRTIRKVARKEVDIELDGIPSSGLAIAGGLGGVVASLSGLGGGVVMVPVMNGFFKINMKIAKSISLGVIVMSSLAVSIVNSTFE